MRRAAAWVPLIASVVLAGCADIGPVDRIVFVTLDTTRVDRLGCYGYDLASTSTLDRLCDESVVFANAVSPAPTTLPSHSSMFTGLFPPDHGVRYNLFFRLPAGPPTLAGVLSEAGWETGGIPASGILDRRFGIHRGFDTYVDPPAEGESTPEHPIRGLMRPAGEQVDRALAWLGEHRGERTFLWVHLYDPHWPYMPPFPYSARFRDRLYDGEIAYMDHELGRLMAFLREDEAWDRTMVVVAGDHGEGLYDHDERWHAILVYDTTQHVPMLIRAPGAAPHRVEEPVSLVDLMPTILDLTGVAAPDGMRGISLRAALSGDEPPRRDLYFESTAGSMIYGWQELRGVRFGDWKLIDSNDPELFDVDDDPQEEANAAALEPGRLADMQEALRGLDFEEGHGAAGNAAVAEIDAETLGTLEGLGYVGGSTDGASVEASPHPRRMIDLEPELLSAQTAVGQRDWKYVENLCRYTLDRNPSNKWALMQMAKLLLRRGDLDAALEHAQLAVRFYPQNGEGYKVVADTFIAKGEPEAAYDVLWDGIREGGSNPAKLRYFAAVAAFDAGRDDVCTREVPEAIRLSPKSAEIRVLGARCVARDGSPEAALAALSEAVDLGFGSLDVLRSIDEFAAVVSLAGFSELAQRAEAEPVATTGEPAEADLVPTARGGEP